MTEGPLEELRLDHQVSVPWLGGRGVAHVTLKGSLTPTVLPVSEWTDTGRDDPLRQRLDQVLELSGVEPGQVVVAHDRSSTRRDQRQSAGRRRARNGFMILK